MARTRKVGIPSGGTTGQVLKKTTAEDYATEWSADSGGGGDVVGPGSSTNGAVVLYDGVTGKLIKNSTILPTTVGIAIANMANPSAVRFIRINADNSVTARTAAEVLTDLYAGRTADTNPLDTDEVFGYDTVTPTQLRTTWANIKVFLNASPALTGTPTAPTASAGTDTTQVATTAFVQDAITDNEFTLVQSFRSLYNY